MTSSLPSSLPAIFAFGLPQTLRAVPLSYRCYVFSFVSLVFRSYFFFLNVLFLYSSLLVTNRAFFRCARFIVILFPFPFLLLSLDMSFSCVAGSTTPTTGLNRAILFLLSSFTAGSSFECRNMSVLATGFHCHTAKTVGQLGPDPRRHLRSGRSGMSALHVAGQRQPVSQHVVVAAS